MKSLRSLACLIEVHAIDYCWLLAGVGKSRAVEYELTMVWTKWLASQDREELLTSIHFSISYTSFGLLQFV
uniref:Uncharacterized protein n=1 Tax=Arundo donax TaxID=35708 RepID=A0A0A8ZP17_ARUDO